MARHDALVVPSVWLETGPLVVLEAQAAGLYIMGSRLGGIAELISEDGSGELVDAGSVPAWTAAIERSPNAMRAVPWPRPRAVRTMAAAAAEMAALYRSLYRTPEADPCASPSPLTPSCRSRRALRRHRAHRRYAGPRPCRPRTRGDPVRPSVIDLPGVQGRLARGEKPGLADTLRNALPRAAPVAWPL